MQSLIFEDTLDLPQSNLKQNEVKLAISGGASSGDGDSGYEALKHW